MGEIEEEMCADAAFDGFGDLIDRAVDGAGDENECEEGDVGHPEVV